MSRVLESQPTPVRLNAGAGPALRPVPGPRLVVVVPTYNEAENLPELVDRLFSLGLPSLRVIVVDDGSPDGTGDVAARMARRFDGSMEVVRRGEKRGLGPAYVEGFSRALAEGADYVLQMDSDLSHDPDYIPGVLEALQDADVVVGSRYVPGGRADPRWGPLRRLLSILGNRGIRAVSGLKVHDATSGFKAFRTSALGALDLAAFKCKGFAFQAEVAVACQRIGLRVVERPIAFETRTRGRSKMSLGIVLEAIWRLLPLSWSKLPG